MIQFRLASRSLYNTYFYRAFRDEVCDAEERYSNVLESLFYNMVSYPEGLQEIPYYETQTNIVVILKNEAQRIYHIDIETNQGNWEHIKIQKNNKSLEMNFECFFDWDHWGIKDNRYIKGVITSFPEYEEYIGKQALIEADDAIFQNS
jgi:hypothetical protein